MATYFTIGEISKLFNISLKTLRYYDEIGLLKPAYKYYNILLDYIKENGIKINGDFNETWIICKMDENLTEKSLIKIDILKKYIDPPLTGGFIIF